MSAKRAHQKPPVHLTNVPPEIWLHILRIATSVPDPLQNPQVIIQRKVGFRGPWSVFTLSPHEVKRHKESLVRISLFDVRSSPNPPLPRSPNNVSFVYALSGT